MLAGNVLAVAHEQRRLQADIVDAMDAGLLSAEHVIGEIMPQWTPNAVVSAIAAVARTPTERLVRELWQDTATELLMTLRVPGAELRLCASLPLDADGRRFPVALEELVTSPEELAAAVGVFQRWDRTGGTGLHEGARDWAVLGERMNYIVNLFRSRQQDPTLAEAPFSDEQLAVMGDGRVPPGPLLPPRPTAPAPGRTPSG